MHWGCTLPTRPLLPRLKTGVSHRACRFTTRLGPGPTAAHTARLNNRALPWEVGSPTPGLEYPPLARRPRNWGGSSAKQQVSPSFQPPAAASGARGGGAPCSWEGPRVSHPDAAWPRAPARRVKALSSVPARSIVAPSGPSTCSAFPPASSDDVPTSRPGSVFYRYAHYQQLNFGTNRTEAIFPNIARKKKIFSWRIPLTNSVQKPDVSTGRQGGRERRAVSRRRGPATRREGGKQGSSGARFPAWVVVLWQKLSGPPQVARAFTPFPPSSVHVRPLHTRSSPSSLADPRVR